MKKLIPIILITILSIIAITPSVASAAEITLEAAIESYTDEQGRYIEYIGHYEIKHDKYGNQTSSKLISSETISINGEPVNWYNIFTSSMIYSNFTRVNARTVTGGVIGTFRAPSGFTAYAVCKRTSNQILYWGEVLFRETIDIAYDPKYHKVMWLKQGEVDKLLTNAHHFSKIKEAARFGIKTGAIFLLCEAIFNSETCYAPEIPEENEAYDYRVDREIDHEIEHDIDRMLDELNQLEEEIYPTEITSISDYDIAKDPELNTYNYHSTADWYESYIGRMDFNLWGFSAAWSYNPFDYLGSYGTYWQDGC